MGVSTRSRRSVLFLIPLLLLCNLILSPTTVDAGRKGNIHKHKERVGVQNVTYDGRSLFINGERGLLFSGSIHYTRSTPDMWPDILDKARHGGLNVIQTYVFWNAHEPVEGKFNFEGNYDLVKFIKLIQEKGMFATLRVGPFIQAEWNHGGLPYWLREIPGIIFRSDNEPFKFQMKKYVSKIVQMMKDEKLFASQGGPIILAQIENEYNHIQLAYEPEGDRYVQWAANMAVAQDIGVPWIMCKQKDAPDPVINACNGRHCGDTFTGPNKPYKPSIWTENWTAQYRVFGDPPSRRSAEDIAFSVARFFSKDGNLVNYYMYHGGTNFGRTSAAFTTTRYYDEAPLDEFGLQREPKWSHLRDAHRALNLCKKPLLSGTDTFEKLNEFTETRVYEKVDEGLCAAFLTNNHSKDAITIKFRGADYFLPPHSISILPDCKTVVYNTNQIVSQHSARNMKKSERANNLKWEVFSESVPSNKQLLIKNSNPVPKELYGLLRDTSDYAWFTTGFNLPAEALSGASPVLRIMSLGHSLLAFVNGEFIGANHGTQEEKTFELQKPVKLNVGENQIAILGSTVGLPDSGAYMEHRYAGPKSISILGLSTGTYDLTNNGWGHGVSLEGETREIFTKDGSKKVDWKPVTGRGPVLSWYKTKFNTPEGRDPVAIRMTGMGKGMIWVNGKSIGRHWENFVSPLGQPTQTEYHIPRSFLEDKENLLVVLEEDKASPEKIEILNVDRDTICSLIGENYPPNVYAWTAKNEEDFATDVKVGVEAWLKCPSYKKIASVELASFGNPSGQCGAFTLGTCHIDAKNIVEKECLGKENCTISLDALQKNGGGTASACAGLIKTLAVQVKCSY